MISNIKEVKPLSNFKIWIEYVDGVKGELDLTHLKGQGVFKVWDNYKLFETVHIGESGAIEWDGELDICPNNAYLNLVGKTYEEYARNK